MSAKDLGITAADVAAFLEEGHLENIVVLFRSEPSLYRLVGELLRDERLTVRLGVTTLVEVLAERNPDHWKAAADSLTPLLRDPSPTVRGDAAYLLGIVGGPPAAELLEELSGDDNADVRELAREALERIAKNS